MLFDDDIRIVSEEGEDPIASPVPDQECQDLPADDQLDAPADDRAVPDEGPAERIIPIEVEGDDQVVPKLARTKGEDESSPLPQRKKAKADLLEEVETGFFQSETTQEQQQTEVFKSETERVETVRTDNERTKNSVSEEIVVSSDKIYQEKQEAQHKEEEQTRLAQVRGILL